MIKLKEIGYGLYSVKIRVLLKKPPFATYEGLFIKPLLSGYEATMTMEGDNKKKLLERAKKVEGMLKDGLL